VALSTPRRRPLVTIGEVNDRDVAIHKATKKDVRALATMMARAFIDDPPCVWILPSSATRERRL